MNRPIRAALVAAIATLTVAAASAQDVRSSYEEFIRQRQQAYQEYIDSRNAEYIRYMRERWTAAEERPAVEAESQPAPPIPATPPDEEPPAPRAVPVAEVVEPVAPAPEPVVEPDIPAAVGPAAGEGNLIPDTDAALQGGSAPTIRPDVPADPAAGRGGAPQLRPDGGNILAGGESGQLPTLRPEGGNVGGDNLSSVLGFDAPAAPVKPAVPDVGPAAPVRPAAPVTAPSAPAQPALPSAPAVTPAAPAVPAADEVAADRGGAMRGGSKLKGPQQRFTFVGTEYAVPAVQGSKPRLRDVSEGSVATLWESFSAPAYRTVTEECLRLRDQLRLDDWGYLKMLEFLASAWYDGAANEAVLLQTFLMAQSGYKVRIARTGQRLVLLVPASGMLYGYRYLELGGEKFFVVGNLPASGGYYVFNRAFPGERLLALRPSVPALPERKVAPRHLVLKRYPELQADVVVDRSLIDYYNLFPCCDVAVYQIPSVGATVRQSLYPALQQALSGRSETEAADMLLNFVQTAFPYATDDEQFGYERPLFAEETLFYPACDCEDRAVLYSLLVRELLGLDVVLLEYPGHVAAAVCFKGEAPGDYVVVRGKRYTVCDPTYIGAGIGRTMPGMDNASVEVLMR